MKLEKATQPTMYFIGVTTGASSIIKVFPEWAEALGLKYTVMKGIDIAIHEKPEVYREVVSFIKNDPLSMGALVTTHKLDIYAAAKDMFEYLDPYALQFEEMSSISHHLRDGHGRICSGQLLERASGSRRPDHRSGRKRHLHVLLLHAECRKG